MKRKSPASTRRRQGPASDTRSTIDTCILAQCMGTLPLQVLINGGILALLVLELGGSKFHVGVLFAANFLAQIIRLFVAGHVDVVRRKRMLLIWLTVGTVLFAAMMLTWPVHGIWGPRAAVWFLIGMFFAERAATNIANTTWLPLIGDLIPKSLRGRFFGRMRGAFHTVSLVAAIAAGAILGKEPELAQFFLIMAIIVAMTAVRPYLLRRLPDPPPAHGGPLEPLVNNILRPWHDLTFRRFLLFWCALVFVSSFGVPFLVPFLRTDLGFPGSMTVYASATMIAGAVIALRFWGRLVDRLGNRFVFLGSIGLQIATFLLIACVPAYSQSIPLALGMAALTFVARGFAQAGLGLAQTVRLLHAAPEAHRGSYVGLFMTATGITAGVTTLLSGALLDALPSVITIGKRELLIGRPYFLIVAALVALTIPLVRRLPRVAEPTLRQALEGINELLPRPLAFPLRRLDND